MNSTFILMLVLLPLIGVIVVPLVITKFIYPRYKTVKTVDVLKMKREQVLKEKKWSKIIGIIAILAAMFALVDLFGPQRQNQGLMLAPIDVAHITTKIQFRRAILLNRNSVLIQTGNDVGNGELVASRELYDMMLNASDPIPVTIEQTSFLGMITKVNVLGRTYNVGLYGFEMEFIVACLLLAIALLWGELVIIFNKFIKRF